jgi:hypothetical protein
MEMDEELRDERKAAAAKGGVARARNLSRTRRREIAKQAAAARWDLPVAKYPGVLKIGDLEFPCAVLSDGETRVLTQTDFMDGMGMYYSGWVARNRSEEDIAADVPHFLSFKSLKPYVEQHLGDLQSIIIRYRAEGGQVAHGIRAEIIPKICEIWMDADENGRLGKRQKLIAQKARIMMRALAHVGIVALVDEVTGFQKHRDQQALAKFLEAYIAKEYRKWVRTFPREFFERLCYLKGIDFPSDMRLPPYFGKIINDLVYDRLAPGVREELARKNPADESGRRKQKHHQWLTEDVGHPKLLHHLGILIGATYGFERGEYEKYHDLIGRILPNYEALPLFATAGGDQRILPAGSQ